MHTQNILDLRDTFERSQRYLKKRDIRELEQGDSWEILEGSQGDLGGDLKEFVGRSQVDLKEISWKSLGYLGDILDISQRDFKDHSDLRFDFIEITSNLLFLRSLCRFLLVKSQIIKVLSVHKLNINGQEPKYFFLSLSITWRFVDNSIDTYRKMYDMC